MPGHVKIEDRSPFLLTQELANTGKKEVEEIIWSHLRSLLWVSHGLEQGEVQCISGRRKYSEDEYWKMVIELGKENEEGNDRAREQHKLSFLGMETRNSILEVGPGTISKLVMWQAGVGGYVKDKVGEVRRGLVVEDFYDPQKWLRL